MTRAGNMQGSNRAAAWMGLGLVLAATAAAQVTLDLETTTFIPSVSTVAQDTANPAAAAAPTAAVSTAYGSAAASSSLGLMQLSATASTTVIDGLGDSLTTNSSARAIWDDTILVTAAAPELDGTSGRLRARFSVSGTLTVPGAAASTFFGAQLARAGWDLAASPSSGLGEGVGGSRDLAVTDYVEGIYITEVTGSPSFQVYDFFIPFIFGDSFNLHVVGLANAYALPRGMALGDGVSATTNVTLTWLGITGVEDGDQNLLGGVTISSTGDWITTSAIPEPSTYAVWAGLTALGMAAWRRRAVTRDRSDPSRQGSPN